MLPFFKNDIEIAFIVSYFLWLIGLYILELFFEIKAKRFHKLFLELMTIRSSHFLNMSPAFQRLLRNITLDFVFRNLQIL